MVTYYGKGCLKSNLALYSSPAALKATMSLEDSSMVSNP
jgi:hypothetical protein